MAQLSYHRLLHLTVAEILSLRVDGSVIPNARRNWTGFQIYVVYFFIAWKVLSESRKAKIMKQVTERFV